jgi:MFS family permease
MAQAPDPRLAGRIAFTYPDFVRYQLARFFIVMALEMQSVAVGWQVYDITKRALDLGLVGLAQFLPGVLLFLVSGHAADRFHRRKLLTVCYAGFGLCSGLLLTIARLELRSVHAIYAVVVLLGVVRSFSAPVSRALLPQLVPEEHFANAVAWNASIFQGAHSRANRGRTDLRDFSRAIRGVRHRHDYRSRRFVCDVADSASKESTEP